MQRSRDTFGGAKAVCVMEEMKGEVAGPGQWWALCHTNELKPGHRGPQKGLKHGSNMTRVRF